MSMEDQIAALVDAVTANTDALQHLAAAYRSTAQPAKSARAVAEPRAEEDVEREQDAAIADDLKRRRGRKPATPAAAPPAPLPLAPMDAPDASVSAAPRITDAQYQELVALVGPYAESHGRSAALAVFAGVGAKNGQDLRARFPEKFADVVATFRAGVEQ